MLRNIIRGLRDAGLFYLNFLLGVGRRGGNLGHDTITSPYFYVPALSIGGLIVAGTVLGLIMTSLTIMALTFGWTAPAVWLNLIGIGGNLIAFALLGFGGAILTMLVMAVILVINLLGDAPLRLTGDVARHLASIVGVSFKGVMVFLRGIAAALPGDITRELPAFEAPEWKQPTTSEVFGPANETLEKMKGRVESWGKIIKVFFEVHLGFQMLMVFAMLIVTGQLRLLVTFGGIFILACLVYQLVTKTDKDGKQIGSWRRVAHFAIWLIILGSIGLGTIQYTKGNGYLKTLGDQEVAKFQKQRHSENFELAALQSMHVATVLNDARTYKVAKSAQQFWSNEKVWEPILDKYRNPVEGNMILKKGERYPYLLDGNNEPVIIEVEGSKFVILTEDNGANVPLQGYEFAVLATDIK